MADVLEPITGVDWMLKLQNNEDVLDTAAGQGAGLVSLASDAQAITGTSDLVALTPGNVTAALAAWTAGNWYNASTLTSATPSTTRLIRSELTLTPSTTLAVGSNGSLAGVRGAVTLTTGKSITDGFLFGVQGKVVADGATIDVSPDHIAGLYGQLSLSGTTLTGGHVAAVIGSIQGTPTSASIDLFYGESATGNVINSYFKAFGKATYVFDFESNVHTNMSTTGTVGTTAAKGWLKVLVEGAVRYIPLADSVS